MTNIVEGSAEQFEPKLKPFTFREFEDLETEYIYNVIAEEVVRSGDEVFKEHYNDLLEAHLLNINRVKERFKDFPTITDADLIFEEINNTIIDLKQIDNHIAQHQVGIDHLKVETREMLASLSESIV
jgi:uncharacterized protein with ParB-like and HNH nuclease domain